MERVARVVLGLEEHDVTEEVMHFLDRSGRARVVATAADERQLAEAVRQLEPDAVVATPGLGRAAGDLDGGVLLALDTSESVQALRVAIRAGARGFFLWPADREALADAAGRARPVADQTGSKRALVVAVYGARGGVGVTFVATHLASALRRQDRDCVLVDLDLGFADVSSVLDVPSRPGIRTVADLLPLVGELSDEHLAEVLWTHPEGFRVLLSPGDAAAAERVRAGDCMAAIAAVRRSSEVVVVHTSRALEPVTRAALDVADRVLLVVSLDVLSFRDTKRALDSLVGTGIEEKSELVVNKASRAEITPRDVERVFGRAPVAVIPADSRASSAQDRGRLLPRRGRTGRRLHRLASRLAEVER